MGLSAPAIVQGGVDVSKVYSCPSSVSVRDAVYLSASDTVDKANASILGKFPAIGFVRSKRSPTEAVVQYDGELGGFSGLSFNLTYFLSDIDGLISSTVPSNSTVQKMAVARSDSKIKIDVDLDFIDTEFPPNQITGLQLWLKTEAITGLVNGDPVSQWNDSSIQGNHLSQATSAKKPTFRTNVANGRPSVKGDGVDDQLSRSVIPAGMAVNSYTVILAIQFPVLNVVHSYFVVGGDEADQGFQLSTTNKLAWSSYSVEVGAEPIVGTTILNLNQTYILSFVRDATALKGKIYLNSILDNPPGGTSILGPTANYGVTNRNVGLFARSGVQFSSAHVLELTHYNKVLSDLERKTVEKYMGQRFGVLIP